MTLRRQRLKADGLWVVHEKTSVVSGVSENAGFVRVSPRAILCRLLEEKSETDVSAVGQIFNSRGCERMVKSDRKLYATNIQVASLVLQICNRLRMPAYIHLMTVSALMHDRQHRPLYPLQIGPSTMGNRLVCHRCSVSSQIPCPIENWRSLTSHSAEFRKARC